MIVVFACVWLIALDVRSQSLCVFMLAAKRMVLAAVVLCGSVVTVELHYIRDRFSLWKRVAAGAVQLFPPARTDRAVWFSVAALRRAELQWRRSAVSRAEPAGQGLLLL